MRKVWTILGCACLSVPLGTAVAHLRDSLSNYPKSHVVAERYRPDDDPKPGLAVQDIPQLAAYWQNQGRDVLIVVAGACGSCTLKKADPSRLDWAKFSRMLVAYQSADVSGARAYEAQYPQFTAVPDSDGGIARALNAVWLPRYYVFSGSGRLKSIQKLGQSEAAVGVEATKGN